MNEVTVKENSQAAVPLGPPAVSSDSHVTRLATGAGVSMAGIVGGRGLHALSQVLLARLLGPELFGLYALGWTILRLVGAFAPLGLDKGVIRFAAGFWRKDTASFKGVVSRSVITAFLAGFLVGVLLYLAAPWAEVAFHKPGMAPVLRWFAFVSPFLATMKVLVATTEITQRMQFGIYAEEFSQPVANVILVVLFAWLGWGILGAVAAAIGSVALAVIVAGYYVLRLFPEMRTVRAKAAVSFPTLVAYSLPTALAAVFTSLTGWTDRLFIGYYRPAAEIGVYQALSQSALLYALSLRAINSIFAPMIAHLYQNREMAHLNRLFKVSTKWALYASLPVFLTISFAPTALMTVVFGQDYAGGGLPLVILSIGQIVNVATGSVGYILLMTGRERQWMTIAVSSLLLNVALNWLLVPRWGLVGAAGASAVSTSLLYLTGLAWVRRTLKLWPYDRRYLKGLLATAVTVVVLIVASLVAPAGALWQLALTAALTAAAFFGALLLLGLDEEDKEFIRLFWQRLRGLRGRQAR
ncbi:MAG: flippase [Chloroflexota bacterium]